MLQLEKGEKSIKLREKKERTNEAETTFKFKTKDVDNP
jgi:hypothetical protein